ncbi:hypothetical protein [Larkinella punicea]|uniref:Uncharacterized protein n=1 Tax=Larkinella punicea TaxID=2315727 RepID=A0A368JQ52_9BACT|nr:hypothetical protein [Larkinella punicea]RCR68311.1 hypothetical protein DUE52_18115 [Larkinella punicea]
MKTSFQFRVSNQLTEACKLLSEQTRNLQNRALPMIESAKMIAEQTSILQDRFGSLQALVNWHTLTQKQIEDAFQGVDTLGAISRGRKGFNPADLFPYATIKINPTDN